MGVHGTFCQLCGLPTQHDHYVPTASGMLKIYRGSSENGGHRWEADERPFPFGPEHAWLKDAVVLPWDEERVIRGPIEDGSIDDGEVFVGDGGEDGLALHHACWELQGSPTSTGPAVRANQTHGWALVEAYQEQLFDVQSLADDGKAWMLADPRTDVRSRARVEAILAIARHDVKEAPKDVEGVLAVDRDWSCVAVRGEDGARKSMIRARLYAIEKADKTGYGTLARVTREAAPMDELEAFEIALKAEVERDAKAILAVAGIGRDRAEYLVYARDGIQVPNAELSADPAWAKAVELIRSLR